MATVDLRPNGAANGTAGPKRRSADMELEGTSKPGRPGLGLACDADGWWTNAGIDSSLKPWDLGVTLRGTVLGLGLFTLALPVLLALAITVTCMEATRRALGLRGAQEETLPDEVKGDCSEVKMTLVLPGTCTYVFWQAGMVHYLCEHFDTRCARLAGVSSGAVSACLLLALEEAAAAGAPEQAAARVRLRAHAIFAIVERRLAHIVGWPLGFVGRLGPVLEPLMEELLPRDLEVGDRFRVGMRRLTGRFLPVPMPHAMTGFGSSADLIAAVGASSTVWLVTRMRPLLWLRQIGAFCADGVNPFSLYCLIEYLQQLLSGASERSAPRSTCGGGLDRIFPAWNCGVMSVLLPRQGNLRWVTPTMGGRLQLQYILRVSGWWIGEQWRRGYAHARDLDKDGYWQPLPRREPPVLQP
mmetsp:Transcript_52620/g.118972  ORF Transcript_52620/g.118972 Transcript_52620/m.118972 type:complete len:413 (+) Transcript_52620:79-1317(+)